MAQTNFGDSASYYNTRLKEYKLKIARLQEVEATKNCKYKKLKYPNGTVEEEGCYLKGKKNGVWKLYTESGWIKCEYYYMNGVAEGPFVAFHENGVISAFGTRSFDTVIDTLYSFDDRAKLIHKSCWVISVNKMGSNMTWRQDYSEGVKPDGTVEIIEGKKYIWIMGEKKAIK